MKKLLLLTLLAMPVAAHETGNKHLHLGDRAQLLGALYNVICVAGLQGSYDYYPNGFKGSDYIYWACTDAQRTPVKDRLNKRR